MVISEDAKERMMGGLLTIASLMESRGYKVPHLRPMRMSNIEDVLINTNTILEYLRGSKTSLTKSIDVLTQEYLDTFNNKIEESLNNKNVSADQLKKLTEIALLEATAKQGITNNQSLTAFSDLNDELKSKLDTIIDERKLKTGDLVGLAVLLYLLKKAVAEEAYKIERIVVTEMQVARNKELEMAFINADPEGRNLYKWNVIFDDRTTSCCKNIHRRVGNGVPLERLREIVNDESAKYNSGNPHWEIRDWNPHVNCRSTLERVK